MKFEKRAFEHREGDEYLLLPSPSEEKAPFAHFRGGRLEGFGVAEHERGQDFSPGTHYLDLAPPGENGRRRAEGYVRTNAPGSVCHSGGNSRAYVDGWDRIFAGRRTAKAN